MRDIAGERGAIGIIAWTVAAFALVATMLAGTNAQAKVEKDLAEALDYAALRVLPFSTGLGLSIEGAEIEGRTLRVFLSSPEPAKPGEDLSRRITRIFSSLCERPNNADILRNNGVIEYDLQTPDKRHSAVLRLTAISCRMSKTQSRRGLRVWAIFQRVTQNGLEQTLQEVVASNRQQLIFDGVKLISVTTERWTLSLSIKPQSRVVERGDALRQRFVNFACDDYLLRTLLLAGARINYSIAGEQGLIQLYYRDCWEFGDLTAGALNE